MWASADERKLLPAEAYPAARCRRISPLCASSSRKTYLVGAVQGWQSVPGLQGAEEERNGLSCKSKWERKQLHDLQTQRESFKRSVQVSCDQLHDHGWSMEHRSVAHFPPPRAGKILSAHSGGQQVCLRSWGCCLWAGAECNGNGGRRINQRVRG